MFIINEDWAFRIDKQENWLPLRNREVVKNKGKADETTVIEYQHTGTFHNNMWELFTRIAKNTWLERLEDGEEQSKTVSLERFGEIVGGAKDYLDTVAEELKRISKENKL
jgi:hypothetical protein